MDWRALHRPPTPFAVNPIAAFYVFLGANILAALYAPIQDCDETFNYWEPTHYLSHGYGLQTWEYSPEYAIRSWTYVAFHALIGSFRRLLPFPTKVGEFYFIRYALAFICAVCQTQLFRVVSGTLNPRIALFFMMAMIFSPGMFHASAAFLPSSFAMYTTMLGMAAFINWRGGLRTAQGIFWFAVGGVLGWPFSIALSAPFLFELGFFAILSSKDDLIDAIMRFIRGAVASLLVLVGRNSYSITSTVDLTDGSYLNSWSRVSFIRRLSLYLSILSCTTSSAVLDEAPKSSALSRGISIFGISSSTSISGLF